MSQTLQTGKLRLREAVCPKSCSKEGAKLGFEPLQGESALKLFLVSTQPL